MTRQSITLAIAIALSLGATAVAHSQEADDRPQLERRGHSERGAHHARGTHHGAQPKHAAAHLDALELSDPVRAEVATLLSAARDDGRALRGAMRDASSESDRAEARDAMRAHRKEVSEALRAKLTDSQWEQLMALTAEAREEAKGGERGAWRRGERGEQGRRGAWKGGERGKAKGSCAGDSES